MPTNRRCLHVVQHGKNSLRLMSLYRSKSNHMFKKTLESLYRGSQDWHRPESCGHPSRCVRSARGREAVPMSWGCAGMQPQPKPPPLGWDLCRNLAMSPRFLYVHCVMYRFPLPAGIFQRALCLPVIICTQRRAERANCWQDQAGGMGRAWQVATPPAPWKDLLTNPLQPLLPHGQVRLQLMLPRTGTAKRLGEAIRTDTA